MTIIAKMKKVEISRKRHVAKSITWRIVGTLDTYLISWLLLHNLGEIGIFDVEISSEIKEKAKEAALLIAVMELITKTILYYFHERIWSRIRWITKQEVRHIIKTISWRLVGAIDTILLVFISFWILFPSTKGAAEVALSMFSIEIITKMILYYIHERVWFKSNFGVVKPKSQ